MKILLNVCFFLLSHPLISQNFDRSKMDEFFDLLKNNEKSMGSISLFQNGKEVYQNTIGYVSISDNILADKNTKYRIGSVSKIFTATMVLKLIEDGKLRLNTKLGQFYPQIANANDITIAMLLNHTSGIYNLTNDKSYQDWLENSIEEEELVKKIASFKSDFTPGSKTNYSNSNYILLSLILEKVSNKTFEALLQNVICKPCKLRDTYYGSSINPLKNEARSYTKSSGKWQVDIETNMSIPRGAGGIISTPTDLNRFLYCLFNNKVLDNSSIDQMIPKSVKYGFGLFNVPFYEKKAVGHTGGIDGFQSNSFYFKDDQLAISFVSNGVDFPVNKIMIGILSIYFNKDFELPTFEKIKTLENSYLQTLVGEYTSEQIELTVTISIQNGQLIFKTFQEAVELEAISKTEFEYQKAGLKLEFSPKDNSLLLKQKGMIFKYKKHN